MDGGIRLASIGEVDDNGRVGLLPVPCLGREPFYPVDFIFVKIEILILGDELFDGFWVRQGCDNRDVVDNDRVGGIIEA